MFPFLTASFFAIAAASYAPPSPAAAACRYFEQTFPAKTYFLNETRYTNATEDYFTSAAWLDPACVFEPSSASEMSMAVKTLKTLRSPFAIRGGGHMPIADAANIDSRGVLLSTYGLNQLKLSSDKRTIDVGPGNRWGNVYDYLEPEKLTVVGGRLGVVGVPGFLLGAGISFFSSEHGWAARNVVSFEAVLADGTIVTASATSHPELYWALKGGANSFALVTNFRLKTIPVPSLYLGESNFGPTVKKTFLDAVHDFAFQNVPTTAIIPTARWSARAPDVQYFAMMMHNGVESAPAALVNFTSPRMPPVNTTWAQRSMSQWSLLYSKDFGQIKGTRQKFWTVSFKVDRRAMDLIHDIFFKAVKEQLASIPALQAGLTYNVGSKSYIAGGGGPSQDPTGVAVADGPLLWMEENFLWAPVTGQEDAVIDAFLESVNKDIKAALEPLNVLHPYLYLNDADKKQAQEVFQGYGKNNVRRLQRIRTQYDPQRVFTDLMPGGFKVADVKV